MLSLFKCLVNNDSNGLPNSSMQKLSSGFKTCLETKKTSDFKHNKVTPTTNVASVAAMDAVLSCSRRIFLV